MNERRIFQRYKKRLEVRYALGGAEHVGITNDVSLTGFFIQASALPAAGETLAITLSVPDRPRLTLEVRVMRSQRAPIALAMEMPTGFAATILKLNEAFVAYATDLDHPAGIKPTVSRSGSYARLSATSAIKVNPAPLEAVFDRGVIQVLIVDEDEASYVHVRTAISHVEVGSYKLEWAQTPASALNALSQRRHEICLLRSDMKSISGLELFQQARAGGSNATFILLVPTHDRALGTRALRAGMADVLDLVTLDAGQLERSIRYALVRDGAANELRLLKKAMETMRLGMVIKDMEGKILFANQAMAEMTGYKVEELIGQPARMLAAPELWKNLSDPEARQMKRWTRKSTNLCKDGSTVSVELSSDLVTDPVGNPIGIVTRAEKMPE